MQGRKIVSLGGPSNNHATMPTSRKDAGITPVSVNHDPNLRFGFSHHPNQQHLTCYRLKLLAKLFPKGNRLWKSIAGQRVEVQSGCILGQSGYGSKNRAVKWTTYDVFLIWAI